MSVKRAGQMPVWQQIAGELRQAISDGTMPPGARLPTESELTERFQVARNTARQALTALVAEGLIIAARPRGYFVRDRRPINYRPQQEFMPQPRYLETDRFIAQHSAEGREARQTIEVSIVDPPEMVKDRLRLEAGELTVVRKRVRYLDGEPFNTNDSYFPLDLVQGTEIMRPDDIARGANEVLAENDYRQVRALDEFYVRMPTPEETRRLALAPGTPVAYHVVTGFTSEGRPVRTVLNVLPGDRHVIAFERTRPAQADS
ncbi:GntR family transcriptional regulator [Micromonospora sp. WMMD1082]|uniref:GntR family transcriptional regulator n=1 Tax=Micromonospora sp. WMMD1082 TaxID=3016104 RepID=UPI0024176AE9|nr:GntR family transcriptional regulator [Micromonospora sp. WMMD1082]MDG4794591.1 GntR family transcriptional regulator [Micromonospora sp. WMMD1082]